MDAYRAIALYLDVRTFVNLTSCNKKFRELYHERGTIWKHFLNRDFQYAFHPAYSAERYKTCYNRKKLKCLENDISYVALPMNILIDIQKFTLSPSPNTVSFLHKYGLIYENKIVCGFYGILCYLCFYNIFNVKQITIDFSSIAFLAHNAKLTLEKVEKETEQLYLDKTSDMIVNMTKAVKKIDENVGVDIFHGYNNNTQIAFSKFKEHPNFQEARNIWLEYGFHA